MICSRFFSHVCISRIHPLYRHAVGRALQCLKDCTFMFSLSSSSLLNASSCAFFFCFLAEFTWRGVQTSWGDSVVCTIRVTVVQCRYFFPFIPQQSRAPCLGRENFYYFFLFYFSHSYKVKWENWERPAHSRCSASDKQLEESLFFLEKKNEK